MDKKHRGVLIAGNWKMNKVPSELRNFAKELSPLVKRNRKVSLVVCPPAICIPEAVRRFKRHIGVGAQNMYHETSGAFTGEISAPMLIDAGAKYVILGHSERRGIFGESDEMINAKLRAALEAGLTPILCVGESLEEREDGVHMQRVEEQLNAAFRGIPESTAAKAVIAYEPIWAIGTGRTATPEQAGEMCAHIRACLSHIAGGRRSRGMLILYGGSMNAANAAELLLRADIDGGLIGGASLTAADFAEIYRIACELE